MAFNEDAANQCRIEDEIAGLMGGNGQGHLAVHNVASEEEAGR